MAPFDKSAPVAESVEKVEPRKEPEIIAAEEEQRRLEQLRADEERRLREEREYYLRAQCDCTAGRASLMSREYRPVPVSPEFT